MVRCLVSLQTVHNHCQEMIMSATIVKVGKSGRNASWTVVRDAIHHGYSFTNSVGSLRGNATSSPEYALRGELPREHHESLHSPLTDYIVWSYCTPIAWRTAGEWVTPDVKYSATTSSHQGKVFTAVSQL